MNTTMQNMLNYLCTCDNDDYLNRNYTLHRSICYTIVVYINNNI